FGIFAHGAYVGTGRNAVGDASPALAEVVGLVDERVEIVELMAVNRNIGGAGVVVRGFDDADHAPLRHICWSDVLPGLTVVAGEMNQAVIGSRPEHSLLQGRLGEGEDCVVIFDASDVQGNIAAGGLLLTLVVA